MLHKAPKQKKKYQAKYYTENNKGTLFCSKCALNLALLGLKIEENPCEERNLRKKRITNFQDQVADIIKICKNKLGDVEVSTSEIKFNYEQQKKIYSGFFDLIIELANSFRQSYLLKLSNQFAESLAAYNQISHQLQIADKQVKQFQTDIEKNYENIVRNMDMKPFDEIMMKYEKKIEEISASIKLLQFDKKKLILNAIDEQSLRQQLSFLCYQQCCAISNDEKCSNKLDDQKPQESFITNKENEKSLFFQQVTNKCISNLQNHIQNSEGENEDILKPSFSNAQLPPFPRTSSAQQQILQNSRKYSNHNTPQSFKQEINDSETNINTPTEDAKSCSTTTQEKQLQPINVKQGDYNNSKQLYNSNNSNSGQSLKESSPGIQNKRETRYFSQSEYPFLNNQETVATTLLQSNYRCDSKFSSIKLQQKIVGRESLNLPQKQDHTPSNIQKSQTYSQTSTSNSLNKNTNNQSAKKGYLIFLYYKIGNLSLVQPQTIGEVQTNNVTKPNEQQALNYDTPTLILQTTNYSSELNNNRQIQLENKRSLSKFSKQSGESKTDGLGNLIVLNTPNPTKQFETNKVNQQVKHEDILPQKDGILKEFSSNSGESVYNQVLKFNKPKTQGRQLYQNKMEKDNNILQSDWTSQTKSHLKTTYLGLQNDRK